MAHSHPIDRIGRSRPGRRNILLLALVAGACEFEDCAGPIDLFDVAGTVMINGQPAQGVAVSAGRETATTAADGTFRMTFQSGTTVTTVNVVSPPGVHFKESQILIAAFDNVSVTFEGYREASISGRVLAFGQPVAGVTLDLDGVGYSETTTSAADGSYRFDGVPPTLVTPHTIRASGGPSGFEIGIAGIGVNVSILGFDVVRDLDGSFSSGARIRGSVTSGGAGLGNVVVSAGGAFTTADTTNAGGSYSLPALPTGSYNVAIAGFDATAHRFATTTQTVALIADTIVNFVASPILPNQPPTASIQQPADGATFQQGAAVAFQGSGTDQEDGNLTGVALGWTSSLDGGLGTGGALTVSSLSVGTHTVTLTATDAQGASGSAAVSLTVTSAPAVPGSISGAVTANGFGIGGAAVTLSGAASASTSTGSGGVYSFPSLMPGTYTVTITNPFPGVTFPSLSQTITLGSGQNVIVNFAGTYGSRPLQ